MLAAAAEVILSPNVPNGLTWALVDFLQKI